MPSTVNPPPRAGSSGSGRRSSPASCAARSRCATASAQRGLGQVASAPVTRSSGQMPPISAMAVASAIDALGLAQRGRDAVAAGRGRQRGASSLSVVGDHGVRARSQRWRAALAASRTARSARIRAVAAERAQASPRPRAVPRAVPRRGRVRRSARSAAPPRRRRAGAARCAGKAERCCRSCVRRLAVRRLPGQVAIGCVRLVHWLVTLAITLVVLAGVGCRALAWRLSQGPVDLPWLARRLEAAANANGGPTQAFDRLGRAGVGGISPGRGPSAGPACDQCDGDGPGGAGNGWTSRVPRCHCRCERCCAADRTAGRGDGWPAPDRPARR